MVSVVNSKADVLKATQALLVNCNAAQGLSEVMKSNLGPRGTLKMLVGGAGQIKITKDGSVLLKEMQIQHPTASMIARAAAAQDETSGDGTTSTILFIAELMKLSQRYITDGVHPRILADGFDAARMEIATFLEAFKVNCGWDDSDILSCIARTSLRTKLPGKQADQLADIIVQALQLIHTESEQVDLHMVEVMTMQERLAMETRLVKGLVLDHGTRHPDMPHRLDNCYILTCNVSLEYEKAEVNTTFAYSNAEQRERLVESERKFTDDKVAKIIELKQAVCGDSDKTGKHFVVINQKGIDPPALDMLAKEGIMALRRAKRRNMERLVLACGGVAVNSVEDLTPDDLGYADEVYEKVLGDDKYTFIEGVQHPRSCTILLKGSNDYVINQMKDAVRDGLRAVRNAAQDGAVVPGAGAFELAGHDHLMEFMKKNVSGKTKLGVEVFAKALLAIPQTLAENSGFDIQDTILKLEEEYQNADGEPVGLDVYTGDAISPEAEGIWDNYVVKKEMLALAPVLAQQLLLVDEVIRAGRQMGKE
ncbi:chaperonin, putative [Perkinsus marinus ATCC 50983]|uniref:Chaperonin, putative n=1 Tax=Perkinsus marinus (strain ATCC 50983 / TXsc) TaxID=423536 RepID=C5KTE1_PERM5|nr:chaperonin, putative [Perkinsus marinus ATCC 50983]EER12246.1 chaperonin, putative [Perkinsus marinus ATCC 50983]|eukprot:XP_002780451.1 chaperonin, putative [Perkinsus marinus ATCC 50983]